MSYHDFLQIILIETFSYFQTFFDTPKKTDLLHPSFENAVAGEDLRLRIVTLEVGIDDRDHAATRAVPEGCDRVSNMGVLT